MDTRLANATFCCDAGILYVFTVVYYRYMLRFTQRQNNDTMFSSPHYTGEI